jgi:transposase-like protein
MSAPPGKGRGPSAPYLAIEQAYREPGATLASVAKRYGWDISTVYRAVKRVRAGWRPRDRGAAT